MDKKERWIYQYPVMKKYLKNKMVGWSMDKFYSLYGYKHVAYYAITEFTELALLENRCNKNSCIDIKVYDTFYHKDDGKYMDYKVEGMEKLFEDYIENRVDLIVVCSLIHENEIIDDLINIGIPLEKIVSIASILYSVV